jgi:hypothetical protein
MTETPTIGINEFVRRQTDASEFTHFEGSFETVARLAQEFFNEAKPGYRDGVCLVPVPPEGFYTGVVELSEGDPLVGTYKARRPGEEPRKSVHVPLEGVRDLGRGVVNPRVFWEKTPAVGVDVVLYRKDVLAEGNESTTDCDWEIVSINGRITEEEQPIHPDTLIANHFELDGGTATGMDSVEFVEALRKSVMYWKNKAMLAPKG